MNEWAFSQLYAQYDQRIIHDNFIEEWKRLQDRHISNFSSDLLLCIFRHCRLEDTRHIMRVCRQWFGATQLREYWMPFVRKTLQEKGLVNWVNLIDPFLFQTLTLGEKVGWLFQKVAVKEDDAGELEGPCLTIACSLKMEMSFFYRTDDPSYLAMCYTNPKQKEHGFVKSETWYLRPKESGLIWTRPRTDYRGNDDPNQKVISIAYKLDLPEPMIYEGEGVDYKPHGKGVWRSSLDPNSSIILQGNQVAWAGLPHGVGTDGNGRPVEYWAGERVERDMETNKRRKVNLS